MSAFARSPRCEAFYSERDAIRAVRAGTEALRLAGEKYLPRELGESQASYKRRLARSFLTNYSDQTVRNLSSKPFTRPVVLKSDRYSELASQISKAVDSRGTSLTGLSSTVFEDALWQGTSFIAVDASVDSGKPYAYHLSADNVLGFRMDEDDKLSEVRILEKATVADGDWGEKEIERVRVFRREGEKVTWSLYEKTDGKELPVELDKPFAYKKIPLFPVHAVAVLPSGELFAPSPVKDLVLMNIQHFQESSDQSNILRVARVPVLFASGIAEDAVIAIGSEHAIKAVDAGANLRYVEHSGAAIGAGRDSLKDLEAKMQAFGGAMLENTGPVETATGRALKAGETNNRIAMIALNLASALEEAVACMAYFNRVSEPDFVVDIETEYGLTVSQEKLTALQTARQLGDLSREDYLYQLKKIGILSAEFSYANNIDRLSTELA